MLQMRRNELELRELFVGALGRLISYRLKGNMAVISFAQKVGTERQRRGI